MSFFSWLRNRNSGSALSRSSAPVRPRRKRSLVLERLEDRTVLSGTPLIILGDPTAGQVDTLTINETSAGLNYNLNGQDFYVDSSTYDSISVDMLDGYNTINVQATSKPLNIDNSTLGNDFVYVTHGGVVGGIVTDGGFVANIHGPVDVRHTGPSGVIGGVGITSIGVQDGSDPDAKTVTMDNGSLIGLTPAPITWTPAPTDSNLRGVMELDITAGTGGNTFNVNDTSPFYHYTFLSAGGGTNQVNVKGTTGYLIVQSVYGGHNDVTVGSLAPYLGGTLADIKGEVDLTYNQTYTNLTLDDSGSTSAKNVTFGIDQYNRESISGLSPEPISYYAESHPIGSGGVRTINVLGGQSDDTFNMTTMPLTALSIDGASGANTLDYSAFTSAVTVNLLQSTATGLAGISRIQNATGGAGNDILIGSDLGNVLSGNGGNDILLGLGGSDTLFGGDGRDVLFGGLGADSLDGGRGDDVLIGSYTLFDTQVASTGKISHAIDFRALQAVMQEWANGDSPGLSAQDNYKTRISHLRGGGGLNGSSLLDKKTVFDDAAIDKLIGGDGFDWFLLNKNQDGDDSRRSESEMFI